MALQDLIDMVKAILLEFQCPEVYKTLKGKAYPNVVGEITAHQAGGLVDYPLSE